MIEAVIRGLIGICLIVLAVSLTIWVLGQLGLTLPAFVVKILWVIAVLLIILWLVRLFRPYWGGWVP